MNDMAPQRRGSLLLAVFICVCTTPFFSCVRAEECEWVASPGYLATLIPLSEPEQRSDDAIIQLVQDSQGVRYIVKQIIDPSCDEQMLLVIDAVTSQFGAEEGIPVNEVFVIPYWAADELKYFPGRGATLHKVVPGKPVHEELPACVPHDFGIMQRCYNPHCPYQQKWPVKIHRQGLSRACIAGMGCHRDLPTIAAFDTFFSNKDRSLPNLFYSKAHDRFYGIDHAAALRAYSFAAFATQRIVELQFEGRPEECGTDVIAVLSLYQDTLQRLHASVTPQKVRQRLHNYADLLCGYAADNAETIEYFDYRKSVFAARFRRNYAMVEVLLETLKKITREPREDVERALPRC